MQGLHKTRRALLATCVAAAGLLTIAGCKAKDAPESSAVARSSPATNQLTSDVAAIASYPLTTENIAKATQVMQRITTLEKTDPALKAQWDSYAPTDDPKSLDEAVEQMNRAPRAPEILRSAGISARDFIYTTIALSYASVGYQLKKAGRPIPPGTIATHINPANIDFVASHQTEIKALTDASSSEEDSSDDNS